MTMEQLLAESRKLPRKERARFALALVRELEDDEEDRDVDTHEAWTGELQKRLDEVNAGTVEPLTLEQFRERVREQREALAR